MSPLSVFFFIFLTSFTVIRLMNSNPYLKVTMQRAESIAAAISAPPKQIREVPILPSTNSE